MKRTILSVLILFCLAPFAAAAELDGRTVLLVVSRDNSADTTKAIRAKLLDTRSKIGFSKADMPIVFMTFNGSETEKAYAKRLGISADDGPVICVVEWAADATNGPKRIIDNSIARRATTFQVDPMLIGYMKAVHNKGGEMTAGLEADSSGIELEPGVLEIESHRFEASGKPNYLADAGVRIKNADSRQLRNIVVRFYSKLNAEDQWKLLDEQVVEKLPKGYVAARDFVGNTRELNLLDEDGNAVECFYRIEVQQGGQVLSREGKFVPSESPVDVH